MCTASRRGSHGNYNYGQQVMVVVGGGAIDCWYRVGGWCVLVLLCVVCVVGLFWLFVFGV